MNALQAWFENLQPRERLIVSVSGGVLLLLLIYLLAWEPVVNGIKTESSRLNIQKNSLKWMRDAAQEVRELKASGNISAVSGGPLSTTIERSLVSAGIRNSVEKMESSGKDQYKVLFNKVRFDRLAQWLDSLQNRYSIMTKSASINNSEESGMVAARITLKKAGT